MSGGGLALTGLVYVFDMFAGFVFISVTCCCVHVLFVWSARPTKLYLKNIEFKMFTCNKKKEKAETAECSFSATISAGMRIPNSSAFF